MFLEPYQTSIMEHFCEYSYRLLAENYFRKRATSSMFNMVLNMPLGLSQSCCSEFFLIIKLNINGSFWYIKPLNACLPYSLEFAAQINWLLSV